MMFKTSARDFGSVSDLIIAGLFLNYFFLFLICLLYSLKTVCEY